MNYRELLEELQQLNEEQLAQDVTVYVSGVGEYYPLRPDSPVAVSEADDVLDKDHFYLSIDILS